MPFLKHPMLGRRYQIDSEALSRRRQKRPRSSHGKRPIMKRERPHRPRERLGAHATTSARAPSSPASKTTALSGHHRSMQLSIQATEPAHACFWRRGVSGGALCLISKLAFGPRSSTLVWNLIFGDLQPEIKLRKSGMPRDQKKSGQQEWTTKVAHVLGKRGDGSSQSHGSCLEGFLSFAHLCWSLVFDIWCRVPVTP